MSEAIFWGEGREFEEVRKVNGGYEGVPDRDLHSERIAAHRDAVCGEDIAACKRRKCIAEGERERFDTQFPCSY
jgi:hypothetical protein